jgi:glycosyltransferase involved in cell wall biosynthesis
MKHFPKTTISVISPKHASHFADVDTKLLESVGYSVTQVLVNDRSKIGMIWSYIRDVIPAVMLHDISYVWFADAHALVAMWAAKIFRKKIVIVVGGYEVSERHDIGYGNQINPRRKWITNTALRGADIIITQSHYYKNIIDKIRDTSGIKKKIPVAVIPPPITIDVGDIDNRVERRDIVMVAACDKDNEYLKGIDIYNTLGEMFYHDKKDVSLLLIGNVDAEVAKKYKFITLAGRVDHDKLIEILKGFKVYCQFSRSESFGATVVEAMACGCIPVVSDCEALPGVVDKYGKVCNITSGWFGENVYNKVLEALSETPDPEMYTYVKSFSPERRAIKLSIEMSFIDGYELGY